MNNDPTVRTHTSNDTPKEHPVAATTTTRPVGRTTSLKRVRTTTAQAIAQTVTTDATWIDQHDQIVDAGLKALGYPPLQDPRHSDS